MIGCYLTGMLPRPIELVEKTRAYERGRIDEEELEKAFATATDTVVKAQSSARLNYITDGMLRWQDLLRPFTESLKGIEVGGLARWFNNNTFYRKPIITDRVRREKEVVKTITCLGKLPKNIPWKAILPAPYTFASLSESQCYSSNAELMFRFAEIINEEIRSLAEAGFKYVQLSDPALVYDSLGLQSKEDNLSLVKDVLETAVKGTPVKTCLQTFFGDFSKILPEALDFPVDNLGIDFFETDFEELKEYRFEKGVAMGLVDSRSSLVERQDQLAAVVEKIIECIYHSNIGEVFICPNCDLEFLPWERARKKMKVLGSVTERLREDLHG